MPPRTSSSRSSTRARAAVDLSGYKLVYRSAAGTSDTSLDTIPSGTTLAAGAFYLFGGSGYAGPAAARPELRHSLASTGGGVALRDALGTIVDSIGYGTAMNAFVRGTAAAAPPNSAAPGTSDVRLPDGHETGDNSADFSVSTTRRRGPRTTDSSIGWRRRRGAAPPITPNGACRSRKPRR